MKKIPAGFIVPSACFTVDMKHIRFFDYLDRTPQVGDLIYGKIATHGQHEELENRSGRIHRVGVDNRAIFVMGHRYAPDAYEAVMPEQLGQTLDLVTRSGIVSKVRHTNANIKEPTQVRMMGYVVDSDGQVINTRNYSCIEPKETELKQDRSKMILVIGSSMNAGKSQTAAALCRALSQCGIAVRGSKITGTASLKDILLMEDCGAEIVNDFSYFGHPSTYLLNEPELMEIFTKIDLKYCNNPKKYWVVEVADGILQREVDILLRNEQFRNRIHKLILAGRDALSVIGCLNILETRFGLIPDAISGVCTSSPLFLQEFQAYTDIPVFDNRKFDPLHLKTLVE